jgi:hypothetical protein
LEEVIDRLQSKAMNAKLPRGTLEKLWSDPANWHNLGVYYCKDDPRMMVPKRIKWAGWTPNFAHTASWIRLLIGMATTMGLIVYLIESGHDAWIFPVIAVMIIFSCVYGWRLSSPERYEEGR